MQDKLKVLRLDASASPQSSTSKKLGELLTDRLTASVETEVRVRDLNQDLAFIDSDWVAANFTAADERDEAQIQRLALSDALIDELVWADRIILTVPMYNFGIPATLKAWIDLICRAGVSFRYTSDGPEGLLQDKSADIVITSGGVPLGSPVDFVSGYLKQVFAFIGIDDVRLIAADQMNVDADASYSRALEQIDNLTAAAAA